MKASAQRTERMTFTHLVTIREHELIVDEPPDDGGDDEGPSPLELLAGSLAACTAITVEMYAKRKGWQIGPVEVDCSYELPERGAAARFELVLRLADACTPEQLARLRVIAAKCPVHRVLEGEVTFEERLEVI